jgi:uncharacterized protein (DUF1778 family)
MLKHIQARVREEDFKLIRKAAIDMGVTVDEFIRTSALEKIERETKRKEGASEIIITKADTGT